MPFLIENRNSDICMYLRQQNLNGLLGFHFLAKQKTAINFRKKQLYLWEQQPAKKLPAKEPVLAKLEPVVMDNK